MNNYNITWKRYGNLSDPTKNTPLSGMIGHYVFCNITQDHKNFIVKYITKDSNTRKFHRSIASNLQGAILSVNASIYAFIDCANNNKLEWIEQQSSKNPIYKYTHRKYRAIIGNFEIATIYKKYNRYIICHSFHNVKDTTHKLIYNNLADAKQYIENKLIDLMKKTIITNQISEMNNN